MKPFISAICLTFARTSRLQEALHCFLAQDYDGPKELIIFNSFSRQQLSFDHPQVKVINHPDRPASLGECRNLAIAAASGDLLVTWDDDDWYLPCHLRNFAEAFDTEHHWYWMDRQLYAERCEVKGECGGSHNTIAFTKAAFNALGGYSAMNCGEDRAFCARLSSNFPGKRVSVSGDRLSFIYAWNDGINHISAWPTRKGVWARAYDTARIHAETRVETGDEPAGEIWLEPKQRDFTGVIQKFCSGQSSQSQQVCIVQLGRFGDIINALPIAKRIHDRYGMPTMMVSEEFASILEGVSYVKPWVVGIKNHEIQLALKMAKKQFRRIVQTQIWGHGWEAEHQTESYNKESWRAVGMLHLWGAADMLPLFDRRNYPREQKLCAIIEADSRPKILVNTTRGHSSPIQSGNMLWDAIVTEFGKEFHCVNLKDFDAPRLFDLLALFERAELLISIDTATLHLAAASGIKVVALVNDLEWRGTSVLAKGCCARIPYHHLNAGLLISTVCHALQSEEDVPAIRIPPAVRAPQRRIFHAVERHCDHGPDQKRKAVAHASWDALYDRGVLPCHYWNYERDATNIGDERALPYLKDVLRFALDQAADEDIVVWTNDDNWLHPELYDLLLFHVGVYECCTSQRCEFKGNTIPNAAIPPESFAAKGRKHMGRDLIAATKEWWERKWREIPDFILGASEFDLAMACLVRKGFGINSTRSNLADCIFPAELPRGYVVHQFHHPRWAMADNESKAPSQRHNRHLFRAWAEQHLPSLQFHPGDVI